MRFVREGRVCRYRLGRSASDAPTSGGGRTVHVLNAENNLHSRDNRVCLSC